MHVHVDVLVVGRVDALAPLRIFHLLQKKGSADWSADVHYHGDCANGMVSYFVCSTLPSCFIVTLGCVALPCDEYRV